VFTSFEAAHNMLSGIELMHTIKKSLIVGEDRAAGLTTPSLKIGDRAPAVC
jgi:hypothetical protein